VSLTNPAAPALLTNFSTTTSGHDHIHGMFLAGDYLFESDHLTRA